MNQKELDEERVAWAKTMRLKFSPRKILLDDGTIDQNYFKPRTTLNKTEKRWTEDEAFKLKQGIQEFGVESLEEIRTHYLPDWSLDELLVKAKELE